VPYRRAQSPAHRRAASQSGQAAASASWTLFLTSSMVCSPQTATMTCVESVHCFPRAFSRPSRAASPRPCSATRVRNSLSTV
jgi:hypothetical protein